MVHKPHEVILVSCPKCGAQPGEPCWKNGKPRKRNHQERSDHATALDRASKSHNAQVIEDE